MLILKVATLLLGYYLGIKVEGDFDLLNKARI